MQQRTILGVIVVSLLVLVPGITLASIAVGDAGAQLDPTPSLDANDVLAHAQGFSGANEDWEPFIHEFDGVEMVLVPAGCFMMGSDFFNSETPIHKQCFDEPFWIDRTEVTRAMYAECVADGICSGTPMSDYSKRYTQPINRVTWFQATDFCTWREARLPTEPEWEYAARGPDSLVYPWGNEFVPDNVVYSYNSDETANVGEHPSGSSWVGALDMSGNVWEWVSSQYADYPYDATDGRENFPSDAYDRVARGGGFVDSEGHVRAARRDDFVRHLDSDYIGFRCARSYQPDDVTQ